MFLLTGARTFWLRCRDLDPREEAEIRIQQIKALVRHTPIIATANLVNSAITVWLFWQLAPRPALLAWLGLLWLLSLARLGPWSRQRHSPGPVRVSERAERRATLWALLAGVLWGGALALLFQRAPVAHAVYLAFVGGGMAAGAATTLATVPRAAVSFIVTTLTPLIVCFALAAGPGRALMAVMMSVFMLFMLLVARGRYADFVEGIRMRLANALLVEELERTRADLLDLIAGTTVSFALFDEQDRLMLWSDNYAEALGYPEGALRRGMSFAEMLDLALTAGAAEGEAGPREQMAERLAQRRRADVTFDHRLPDGRWIRTSDRRTSRGGIITVHVDITELKQRELALSAAAEEKTMLLRELQHRVKNSMAGVRSIAVLTQQRSDSLEAFGAAFDARLAALSAAHDLLAQGDWRSADLRALVGTALRPFDDPGGRRLAIAGDDMVLGPNPAMSLGMVLHELATNAAKYGALSAPGGRLEVRWRTSDDGRQLHLSWRESGGPTVKPPTRRGFGTTLIEGVIAYELGGTVDLTYAADGLRCEIALPWPGDVAMRDRPAMQPAT